MDEIIKERAAEELRAELFAEMEREAYAPMLPGDVKAQEIAERFGIDPRSAIERMKKWPKAHEGWEALKVFDPQVRHPVWVLRKIQ